MLMGTENGRSQLDCKALMDNKGSGDAQQGIAHCSA